MGTWLPFRRNLKGTHHLELLRARSLWLYHCKLASVETFQWHQRSTYGSGHVVDLTVFNLSFSSLRTVPTWGNCSLICIYIHHFTDSSAWLYFSSSALTTLVLSYISGYTEKRNLTVCCCPGVLCFSVVYLVLVTSRWVWQSTQEWPLRASVLRATMAKCC